MQRSRIEAACGHLELELVAVVRDHVPLDAGPREGLTAALDRIGAGEASCLVVSELGCLGRDVAELAAVVDRLERERARLIVLDVGLDTATPAGRLAISPSGGADPPPEPEREPAAAAVLALGYASLAAADADGGRSLEEQRQAIELEAARLGLQLVEVVRERERDGRAHDRAGLSYLLERIAAGDAGCVVVSGLDRLGSSIGELGTILQWLQRNEVRLIVAELQIDTASPGGRTTVMTLASVAGWERERLSERTRKGLAAARAKRHAGAGAAETDWGAVRRRIAAMRADGMTLQAIADVLNREGVPTQRGGAEWRPSSVQTAAGYKRRPRASPLDDLPRAPG